MTIPHVDSPGPWHEAAEENGAFHVRPTKAFAARFDMGWAAVLVAAVALLPVVFWAGFTPVSSIVAALLAACVLYASLPRPRPEPLVLSPGGRIEYRGVELRPKGPATGVRVLRRQQGADDPDTYHLEVLSEGEVVELPEPDFGKAEGPAEVAVLAAWLAQVISAPLGEEVGEGPTAPPPLRDAPR
jgi:hypothetical protein